jgi:small subunit ribosomal protein S20
MANIKQQVKRIGQDAKRRSANTVFKSSLKTAVKRVEEAASGISLEDAQNLLNTAFKKLDKALVRGIHHKNYVARQKARLQKHINEMLKSPQA